MLLWKRKKFLHHQYSFTSSKKRTTTTDDVSDDTEAKKPKIETTDEPTKTNSVFKKTITSCNETKKIST